VGVQESEQNVETRAAYRYALALLETAEEQDAIDRVSTDLRMIEDLIRESREFLVFLRSPVINTQKKKSILTELFGKQLNATTFGFLLLLTTKNREAMLPEIIQQFYRLRDERAGIVQATVRTPIPLTKEQEKKLSTTLERIMKKKIRLQEILDPQVKGGARVQIGDTVWDGSVAHQLEVLRERFTKGVHA